MSEDDNDRMERANRIREMREGRRSTPTPEDADATDENERMDDDDTVDDADDRNENEGATGTADAPDPEAARSGGPAHEPDGPDAADGPDPLAGDREEPSGNAEPVEAGKSRPEGAEGAGGPGSSSESVDPDRETGFDFGEPRSADAADNAGGTVGDIDDSGVREAVGRMDELSGGFAIPDQATSVTDEGTSGALTEAEGGAAAHAAAGRSTVGGDSVRVLEFELGDERYCLDIDYIEEIVEVGNVTRVPNSPSHIEGVVDLRGQVTAIIDPTDELDAERTDDEGLIIVFDSETFEEQSHLGWIVDEVRQVTPIREADVNESPEDEDHVNGIVNREDEDDLVVWTTPDLALNT